MRLSDNKISMVSLLLLAAVGVAASRRLPVATDSAVLQPIVALTQQRQICSELCTAGLGGGACGDGCVDVGPQGLPLLADASASTSNATFASNTRFKSCDVLCANGLGFPLCPCSTAASETGADFVQVCAHFCAAYDYRVFGCQECSVYRDASEAKQIEPFKVTSPAKAKSTEVDWDVWCLKMCKGGDGGAACNCDILPMRGPV